MTAIVCIAAAVVIVLAYGWLVCVAVDSRRRGRAWDAAAERARRDAMTRASQGIHHDGGWHR